MSPNIQQIGNKEITRFSPGIEFIDGLFQAFAVRAGGFYVVSIPTVRISLQVLYVIMMYISAFPVAITIRNSNVYEERSLGIYSDDPGYDDMNRNGNTLVSWAKKRFARRNGHHRGVFVQQQLRAQLVGTSVFFIASSRRSSLLLGARYLVAGSGCLPYHDH